MNGSVIYDLTAAVDFSHPGRTGKVLAKVIFEKDVSKWIDRDDLYVTPDSRLEIHVSAAHNRKSSKTIKKFKKYLAAHEIRRSYKKEIWDYVNTHNMSVTGSSGGYIGLGIQPAPVTSVLEFRQQLISEVMAGITVSIL